MDVKTDPETVTSEETEVTVTEKADVLNGKTSATESGSQMEPLSTQDGEDSTVLKHRQTSALSKVTKNRNKLVRLMLDTENLSEVKIHLTEYDELAYQDAHIRFC